MAGTKPTNDGSEHEQLRREALADIDMLVEHTSELRGDLDTYLVEVAKARRNIAAGGRASDMPTLFDVPAVRISLSDRLNAIERARATARRSLWRLQIDEGLSIAQVARLWGFSRQLVSRALSAEHRRTAH